MAWRVVWTCRTWKSARGLSGEPLGTGLNAHWLTPVTLGRLTEVADPSHTTWAGANASKAQPRP